MKALRQSLVIAVTSWEEVRPVDLVPRNGLKPRIREAVLSSAEVVYPV
jgi:hypothetical protein